MKGLTVVSLVVSSSWYILQLVKELGIVSWGFVYNIDMDMLIRFLTTWFCVFWICWGCRIALKFLNRFWQTWRPKRRLLKALCALPKERAELLDYVYRRPTRKALMPVYNTEAFTLCHDGYLTTDYIAHESAAQGFMCYLYSIPNDLWRFIKEHHEELRAAWGTYERPDLDKYQRIAPGIKI